MDNLIESGFESRRNGNEDLELYFFNMWIKENSILLDDSFKAELLWEIELSKLKMKHSHKFEVQTV